MLEIIEANSDDYNLLNKLAKQVWEPTYGKLLSSQQLEYMFEMMYSVENIRKQIEEEKNVFFIAYSEGTPVGYASVGKYANSIYKLHKLYIVPEMQKTGVGYFLLQKVVLHVLSKEEGNPKLRLNVNRENTKAQSFYFRQGFEIIEEGDFEIGNGFYMKDFIMELDL